MSDPSADTPPSGTPAIATPYDLVKLLLATRSEMALLNERLRNLPAPVATPKKGSAAQVAVVAFLALGVIAQASTLYLLWGAQ